MKKGVLPSDAIKAIKKGLSFLDCGAVCLLSYIIAVLDLLGEERFNFLFRNINLNINDSDNLFVKLIPPSESSHISGSRRLDKAEMVHVSSLLPHYHAKHPNGFAQGYNLLCLESGNEEDLLFLGFGLNESGMSLSEVRSKLLSEFNAPTLADDMIHPTHKTPGIIASGVKARELDSLKITEREFIDGGAGKLRRVGRIDFKKLDQIARAASNEEALALLMSSI